MRGFTKMRFTKIALVSIFFLAIVFCGIILIFDCMKSSRESESVVSGLIAGPSGNYIDIANEQDSFK